MPNSLPDKPRALALLLQPPRRLSGQLKRLGYYLSSGFSRSVGSWSIKERRLARVLLKVLKGQIRIAVAAHADDQDEEEAIAVDIAKAILCIVLVPVVPRPPTPLTTVEHIADLDDYCQEKFRFRRQHHMHALYIRLNFPPFLVLSNGAAVHSETCFIYTLRRLVSEGTTAGLCADGFGGEKTKWGRVLTATTSFLVREHRHRLDHINPEIVRRLPMYAHAIERHCNDLGAGMPVGTCRISLFVDCEQTPTCRLGGGPAARGPGAPRWSKAQQRAFYNGWKRNHGLKAETVIAPDGLTVFMFGLLSLRRSDLLFLNVSKINQHLHAVQVCSGHETMTLDKNHCASTRRCL